MSVDAGISFVWDQFDLRKVMVANILSLSKRNHRNNDNKPK